MHDFTWKSLFKLWSAMSLITFFFMYNQTEFSFNTASIPQTLGAVGGAYAIALVPTFFLYMAFAPFAAACSEAYRYERQRGGSWLYAAACGVASMFGLLLVLIPVALVMAVIYAFWRALQQVNGLQLVLGMLGVLGTIAFVWEAIKTRLHLNKLNVFKLSDSRKIIRK